MATPSKMSNRQGRYRPGFEVVRRAVLACVPGADGIWYWYFRGDPHVHVWVNIADDHTLPLNARG